MINKTATAMPLSDAVLAPATVSEPCGYNCHSLAAVWEKQHLHLIPSPAGKMSKVETDYPLKC